MPAIFSRSLDGTVRQVAVGLVVAVGLFVTGWYYYALPSYTRVGYTPEQPVPFSHQLHVGQLGLDCTYCHQARVRVAARERARGADVHELPQPEEGEREGHEPAARAGARRASTPASRSSGSGSTSCPSTRTSTTRFT